MRVLMLCSSYPLYATDSASIFLRHLALALTRVGVDVHILAPDHLLLDESFQEPPIQVSHFRYFPRRWQTLAYGSGILPNLRRYPWRWFQVPFFVCLMTLSLVKLCRQSRPDIIHAHWILPQGVVAVVVGRLLRIPVVTTIHGGDAFSLRGWFLGRLKRFALCHSQAWTANTRTTATAVKTFHSLITPKIIPMGVDVKQFAKHEFFSSNKVVKKDGQQVLLFVGRLVEKKGVADLIEAYKCLTEEQIKATELWIIGDGTERERLEQLTHDLKISDRVRFFGRIAHDELPMYYAVADIFSAPSIVDRLGDTEGQGVVIIEAMASGVPIVATNVGGIPDVITHERTGILVEPQNPLLLNREISRLLRDRTLRQRLGHAGQLHARLHYDWEIIAKRFMDVYSDVLLKKVRE